MRKRPREENADELAPASIERAERMGAIHEAADIDADKLLDSFEGRERDDRVEGAASANREPTAPLPFRVPS